MAFLRIFLLAFNVAVFAFLIYRLLQVYQAGMEISRKRIILAVGIILVVLPVIMVFRIIPPTPAYILIYPVAISLFLYLIRVSDGSGAN